MNPHGVPAGFELLRRDAETWIVAARHRAALERAGLLTLGSWQARLAGGRSAGRGRTARVELGDGTWLRLKQMRRGGRLAGLWRERYLGSRRFLALEHSELLYLMRHVNPLPLIYWNLPAWYHLRASEQEPFFATARRLLDAADADAVVTPGRLGYDAELRSGYEVVVFSSENGRYSVPVALRSAEPHADSGPGPTP